MKTSRATTTNVNISKLVEYAKQTSACGNLSRLVQTCLSADGRYMCLVREYAPETFEDVLRRGGSCSLKATPTPLPVKLLKSWLTQSLVGLEYLHACLNTCHSNLKPSNVLLVGGCQLKLADFVLDSESAKSVSRLLAAHRNRPYLAPETLTDMKYSAKSDVFSLAAIFFELVCGGRNLLAVHEPETIKSALRSVWDRDEYLARAFAAMLCASDTDRPGSSETMAFLSFFDSIEPFSTAQRSASSAKSPVLVKFKQTMTDKKFILKRITLDSTSKSVVLNDLLKVSHENLSSICRHVLIEYNLYILRDYQQDFANLRERLDQMKKVDENTLIRKWLPQIIDALEHLHSLNVLHANLKLENVLIRPRDDQIKLTDFAYAHRTGSCQFVPEIDSGQYSTSSDVYQLGWLLFECMRPQMAKSQADKLDFSLLDNSPFSKRTKKSVQQMLEREPNDRPTLAHLKTHLLSAFHMDLTRGNQIAPIDLDRKIIALEAVGGDEFLTISCKKRRQQIGFSLLRVKFGANVVEKMNFNCGLMLTRNSKSSSCACSKYPVPLNADYPTFLPKVMCALEANFLMGCNSNFVYFFDANLKYVKRMCLLEMLESRCEPSRATSPAPRSRRHSSMIKKSELKLEVDSVCVDRLQTNQFRVYLLITVLQEVCLLSLFRLDMSELNRNSTESSSPIEAPEPKISLENSIHLGILKPALEKSMKCNQNYLFVCERLHLVRVFSKQGKLLFTLDKDSSVGRTPSPFDMDSTFEQIHKTGSLLNRLEHLDVDKLNGYLYVVYEHAIRVYDQNCDFLWEYDLRDRAEFQGKAVNVCLGPSGAMGLVLQDPKNEFSSRLFLFK